MDTFSNTTEFEFFAQESNDHPAIWSEFTQTNEYHYYGLAQHCYHLTQNSDVMRQNYDMFIIQLTRAWNLFKAYRTAVTEAGDGPFLGPDTPADLGDILDTDGSNIFPGENTPHIYPYEETEMTVPNMDDDEVRIETKRYMISTTSRNHIVYGRFQEGKSTASSILLINMARKTRMPLLWVTQNQKDHMGQIKKNMKRTMREMGIERENLLPIHIITPTGDVYRKFAEYMENRTPGIFIILGNKTRTKKLVREIVNSRGSAKFLLGIDEADIYFSSSRPTDVSRWLRTIIDISFSRFMISATYLDALKAFGTNSQVACHRVVPRPGYTYKGIDDIELSEIDTEGDPQDIIVNTLEMIERERVQIHRDAGIATIVLGVTSMRNENANIMCGHVLANTSGWCAIEYNNSTNKTYERAKISYLRRDRSVQKREFDDISDAIDHCVRNNRMKIFITGGMLFSRGINFVSNDYVHHPTDMIYTMNPSALASTEAHRLARVLGIDRDSVKRVVHTSRLIFSRVYDIVCANTNFAEMLEENPDNTVRRNAELTTIPRRFCRNKLSKLGIEMRFRQTDPRPEIPMYVAPEPEEPEAEESDADRDTEIDDIDRVGIQRVQEAYQHRRGNVRKIIDEYVRRGFASMSLSEIRRVTGNPRETIANFTRWDITHGRYKIIETNSNRNYILRHQIIDALGLTI